MTAPTTLSSKRTRADSAQALAIRHLAAAECRRMVRSPALILGLLLAVAYALQPWFRGREPDQMWGSQNYVELGRGGMFLFLLAFLIAVFVAGRERPSTTEEIFAPAPLPLPERTLAILGAAVVPVTTGVLLVVAQYTLVSRAGGITLGGEGTSITVSPTLVEAAEVPVLTLAAYTAGIASVRLLRSRAAAALLGCLLIQLTTAAYWVLAWFPALLIVPLGTRLHIEALAAPPGQPAAGDRAFEFDVYTSNWILIQRDPLLCAGHTIYLLGAACLFSALALAKSGRSPHTRPFTITGALLALIGIAVQLATYEGQFRVGGTP